MAHPDPRRAGEPHANNRLYREALIAAVLPAEVGYPTIVAHGGGRGEDWLVAERVPGRPLAHVWPDLTEDQRHAAVDQLAERLVALHRTRAPADLPPIEHAPQLLEVGAHDPTGPVVAALHQAMRLEHVDPAMLAEAAEMVARLAPALVPFEADTLVHGDVTFENVLWHEGEVTALLDVEWARPGPRDLDLDILLRCAAYPQLHVAEAHEERTRAEDYARSRGGSARPTRGSSTTRARSTGCGCTPSPTTCATCWLPRRRDRPGCSRSSTPTTGWPASSQRKSYLDVLGRGRI